MSSFRETLDRGGDLLAAWDDMDNHGRRLCLFAVGASGARLVADADVLPEGREEMVDLLLDRGVRIGQTYGNQVFVWVMDEQGCRLWSDRALVADGNRAALRIDGTWVAAASVKSVTTFYDPQDRGHRGVFVMLAAVSRVIVAEEHDETAKLDPSYGLDNLFLDGIWASYLGQDLAMWMSVRHEDQIAHVDLADALRIQAGARALANEIERLSGAGDLQRSFGVLAPAGELVLRFAADPERPERHLLELRVSTPSAKSWSVRGIRHGSTARIAAFLREGRFPSYLQHAKNDLQRQQKIDGLA